MLFGKPPPSATPPPRPETAPANSAGGPSRGTILVVDDSSMFRVAVSRALSAQRFTILTANDGQQGLTEWQGHKAEIKLIVSDVFMPVMDGLAMAKKMRAELRTLPILLMSSKLDDDSRWVAEEAGFRLLPKPFKDELLVETVNRMLRLAYGTGG